MDIEKLFKEFVEKEWHDGHEPQGGYDHYEEEMEDVEIDEDIYGFKNYPKRNKVGDEIEKIASKGGKDEFNLSKIASELQKGRIPHKFIKKLSSKSKKAVHDIMKDFGWKELPEDKEIEEKFEKEARSYIDAKKKDKEKKDYKKKYGREPFSFSGKHISRKHSMGIAAEFDPELDEGYKDLPPHLQKLVKKIEKKQKDWNKQNPNAKIKTLVYNPDTGKPDIEVKENTMKLVDTVKQVLDEHCGVCGEQGIEEDSDPEEKGTQGDDKEYQAKRDEILKGYGVKACGLIKDEKTKAQCFKDLDDAHVADHEEGYGYNPHPPEGKPTAKKHKAHKSDASPDVGKISEAFWKVNIPDMPPIFVEASSASEIKKDMRTKLRPDVVKELAIERVSKSEMVKKYRELAKGGGDDEEEVKEGWPEIGKMKDSIGDMIERIKELQDRGEDEPGQIDDMRKRIQEKQRKIKELEAAQRSIDAKKKKTGPATGFSVGHRESVEEDHGKTMHDKLVKASQKVADDYNKGAKPKTEVKATGTGAKMPGHCESTDSKLYASVKKMMKK